MQNSFALLGNVEGDASAILERLAEEAKAMDQKHKRNTHLLVREGKGGQGGGSRRYGRNNGIQFEYGQVYQNSWGSVDDGWKRNNGGGNGYQQGQGGRYWMSGRNDGQQFSNGQGSHKSGGSVDRNNGAGNGYQQGQGGGYWWSGRNGGQQFGNGQGNQKSGASVDRNNGGGNGYQQGYRHGDGGIIGRGRGLVGAPNGQNGAGKKTQMIEGNQQVQSLEQGGDWEKVGKKQQRNGNSSYSARGRNGGRNNGNVYEEKGPRETSRSSGNHSMNGDNGNLNVAAATQVSKDDVQGYSGKTDKEEQTGEARGNVQEETEEGRKTKSKEEQERIRMEEEREAMRKYWEEERKKKTLKQYEEEKRKHLDDIERPQERKVSPDKDFKSMQLVGKKKEYTPFCNQDTENGKLKRKDDKVRKSMSLDEFLIKPAKGENRSRGNFQGSGVHERGTSSQQATYRANGDRFPQHYGCKAGDLDRRGGFQGRGGGGNQRATWSRQATDRANGDKLPQPTGSKENVANVGRLGGRGGGEQGGLTRGSSADPIVVDAPSKEPVKVKPPTIDDTQFPRLGAPAVKK